MEEEGRVNGYYNWWYNYSGQGNKKESVGHQWASINYQLKDKESWQKSRRLIAKNKER